MLMQLCYGVLHSCCHTDTFLFLDYILSLDLAWSYPVGSPPSYSARRRGSSTRSSYEWMCVALEARWTALEHLNILNLYCKCGERTIPKDGSGQCPLLKLPSKNLSWKRTEGAYRRRRPMVPCHVESLQQRPTHLRRTCHVRATRCKGWPRSTNDQSTGRAGQGGIRLSWMDG